MTGAGFGPGEDLRRVWRVSGSMGRPGWAWSACWRASNGTGAGGGASRTTTGRDMIMAGGWAAGPTTARPSTLSRCGARGAYVPLTGACMASSRGTMKAELLTGCARTNVWLGTMTTAPGTERFTYR